MTATSIPDPHLTATHRRGQIPGAVVAAVGGPLLLAVTNALVGFGPVWKDVEYAGDLIAGLAAHPVYAEICILLGAAAAVLLVPGVWAVTLVLRRRTPWLAAIGGWLMATGYVMSVVLSVETALALAMATSGGDPAPFADAVDNHSPAAMTVLYLVFGVGALGGGLILGIAMLRQRGAVPAWAGWALIASEPVRVAGLLLGVAVGPPLASLLILVAFAGVLRGRARGAVPE